MTTVGLSAVLAFGVLPGSASGSPPTGNAVVSGDAYDPAGEPESAEAVALAEARASDEPVEVLTQRGETREVFALPDGSLEAREYVVPVWTRVSGEWAPVDLELVERADGAVGPKASTVELEFSAGGDGPLVTLARHGREMSRTWPGALPTPVLDGPVATYPEVLTGVDLRMEATPDGFTSLVVVKSAEAAQDPALDEVRFGLELEGLDLAVSEAGGLTATDAGSGALVFEAPAPLMWDSSTPPGAAEGPQVRAVGPGSERGEVGAGESGRLAVMEVAVSSDADELTLTPDPEVLRGEGTEYPVFIDPQDHAPRAAAWTMVSRHWASSPQWKFNGQNDEGLGYCVGWARCNPNEVKRLFYQIDTSRFAGTRVLKAEFTVPNTHSAQCVNRPVELWRTKSINANTTWNTQQASGFWIERLRTESFHYGGDPSMGCRPARDAEFDVRAAVQRAADSRTSSMTFGLRASNETSNLHWKRFGKNAHLRVTYNRAPHQIKMSQLTMEYGGACKASGAAPYVRTLGQIHANNVTDPDGDSVRVQFRVRTGSDVVWTSSLSTAKRSGSSFAVRLPSNLPQNTRLNWQARSYDGSDYSPWTASGSSASCFFFYDRSVPAAPSVSSNRFPESDPAAVDDPWFEGAGHYGAFTLTAADSDVTRYWYGVNGDPTAANQLTTSNGAARVVQVLPQQPGLHFVTAQAFDQAGNASEIQTYQFRVSAGQAPRMSWALDEPEGSSTVQSDDSLHTGELEGGSALGSSGVVGNGLELDGTGNVSVSGHVTDTSRPFTVSAWARLDEKTADSSVVVEQVGRNHPGFVLYYSGHFDQWAFMQYRGDDPSDGRGRVLADAPVRTGEWTHLLGSYDGQRLRLFVDGTLAGTTAHADAWSAQTALEIGAARRAGDVRDRFHGGIDEVQLFDYAMTSETPLVSSLFGKQLVDQAPGRPAVAVFSFDEAADARQTVGRSQPLPVALHGGAQTGAAGVTATGMALNGVDSYGAASAGTVDTSQSFAVSAWARLDKSRADTAGIIATQVASERPGFELYYSRTQDRWAFNQYSSNAVGATPVRAAQPSGTHARDGEWEHLVGVHDAQRRMLSLYVNGLLVSETAITEPWHASGRLQLGAGQYSGELRSFFAGEIDDVRVHNRMVTPHEVTQMFHQSPVLKARWMFEQGTTFTPDASPSANHLVFGGGAGIGAGVVDQGALQLDGAAGYAATGRLPADTSASFTVAGWAQAVGAPGQEVSLVSAPRSRQSAFSLRFVPHPEEEGWGSWRVAVPQTDSNGAVEVHVDNQLFWDVREWNHLALVYDGFTKRVELYVNGQLQEVVCGEDADSACAPGASWAENVLTFEATHSLQVGRTWKDGAWEAYWPGAVDDLWFFQGALTALQVRRLAEGQSGMPTESPAG
ncbi:LamG-like jellyroll fold domain-containing protein [Streptomyces otsuchiensis]|uniref:LamG-like jellyroll fold domain-containing protein n=1 Tax=Streptomyces otsuchiensis TaxID=2681388 RepID=UPI001D13083B|nr:LamG-like jellyroll fold domain-containing protein [Streptomyces otsuchiensis]